MLAISVRRNGTRPRRQCAGLVQRPQQPNGNVRFTGLALTCRVRWLATVANEAGRSAGIVPNPRPLTRHSKSYGTPAVRTAVHSECRRVARERTTEISGRIAGSTMSALITCMS